MMKLKRKWKKKFRVEEVGEIPTFFSFSEIIIDKGRKADIMEYVLQRDKNGPLVKGLRHRLFTAVTRVRIRTDYIIRHSSVGSSA